MFFLHFSSLALYHRLVLTCDMTEGHLWFCYCLSDRIVENFVSQLLSGENTSFLKPFLLKIFYFCESFHTLILGISTTLCEIKFGVGLRTMFFFFFKVNF